MKTVKTGFIYYNVATDRFQDLGIKRLKRAYGCIGYAVFDYILNESFRVNGYYLEWDENILLEVADYWGLEESKVEEIVQFGCTCGLIDSTIFNEKKIITSAYIQERYQYACLRMRRKPVEIEEEYCRLTPKSSEIVQKSSEIVQDMPINVQESDKRKDKTRKDKIESVVAADAPTAPPKATKAAAQAATQARKQAFRETLEPYRGRYGEKMLRDFFGYWTELNRSGTRMRYEMEKAWELPRRLTTWEQREKKPRGKKTEITNYEYEEHYEKF